MWLFFWKYQYNILSPEKQVLEKQKRHENEINEQCNSGKMVHIFFLFFYCLQMTNLIRNQIRQCETVGCLSQASSPREKRS